MQLGSRAYCGPHISSILLIIHAAGIFRSSTNPSPSPDLTLSPALETPAHLRPSSYTKSSSHWNTDNN